jgi:glycolate oxidase iron-sulfur subunit
MRVVQWQDAEADREFVSFMDACVQCRGCETACPSGVPFGRLMEGTRTTLAATGRMTPWWQRLGLRALGHHRLLLAGSKALAVGQRARLVPRRLGLPRLPLRQPILRPSGTDVWLFTGCVMDAWQRSVHLAAQRVLHAAGVGVALPGRGAACCGALHVHAGLTDAAAGLAERVMAAMPGDAPIVVDSAGCGAAMKGYGHLLGTQRAIDFSARVVDIHEWLAAHLDDLPGPRRVGRPTVAVQDPCHLRHVQRAHQHVRTVLRPYVGLVELDDEGLCCGAGGAYATFHPEMAADIRERKLGSIARSGATVVASANPGCALHLAAAGVVVRHPVELIDDALRVGASD